MIKREVYVCSICGRTFPFQTVCEKHEKFHRTIKGENVTDYVTIPNAKLEDDIYPKYITVKFDDGSRASYIIKSINNHEVITKEE